MSELVAASVLTSIIVMGALPSLLRRQEAASVSEALRNLRTTAFAVESYYLDHLAYPVSATATGTERAYESQWLWELSRRSEIPWGVPTINSFAPGDSGAARLVTFQVAAPAGSGASTDGFIALATLTTPVAYLSRFREDPFSRTPNASLGYFGHANESGWIIFSLGPDRDENAPDGPGDISPSVEYLYDVSSDFPGMWLPSSRLIDARYDPTNGLFSNGDIYRMHGD